MEGDVIYVVRKPIGFRSFDVRRTSRSGKLDQLVHRTIVFRHYGIEVENGYVIHFVGESINWMQESIIKKTTMEEFLKDGIKKVDTDITYKFNRERVVKRAYSRLNTKFDGYSLYKNNCEHFAAWCANGYKASRQVNLKTRSMALVKYPIKAKNKIASFIAVF